MVERYVYDPYGGTTVLTGDGSPVLREADRGYFFDVNYNQVIDDDDWNNAGLGLQACLNNPLDPHCVFMHDVDGEVTLSGEAVFGLTAGG